MRQFRLGSLVASLALAAAWTGSIAPVALAQAPQEDQGRVNPEDKGVDVIRGLDQFNPIDQDRIKRWVDAELQLIAKAPKERFADGFDPALFKEFRDRALAQHNNSANSKAFQAELAKQTAQAAIEQFNAAQPDKTVVVLLARLLVDYDTMATLDGLLAAVGSSNPAARFFGVRGLNALKSELTQNEAALNKVINALSDIVANEDQEVVREEIYRALAIPGQVPQVFPAYLAGLDRQLAARRTGKETVDRAEIAVFEFLSKPQVLSGLDQAQQVQLASRLAPLLQSYAERYTDPVIAPPTEREAPDPFFFERDTIERSFYEIEEILSGMVGSGGGDIRGVLQAQGFEGARQIPAEVEKWIGNANSGVTGALNAAPWNVPVGAP